MVDGPIIHNNQLDKVNNTLIGYVFTLTTMFCLTKESYLQISLSSVVVLVQLVTLILVFLLVPVRSVQLTNIRINKSSSNQAT